MWLDRQRELVARRQAQLQARDAGRYWREPDAGRQAQQPTHVQVDPDAWKAVKAKAAAQGRTVGALVGYLVTKEVHRCIGELSMPPLRTGALAGHIQGRQAKLFARLGVTKEKWQQFRSIAAGRGITVARYVGIPVEKTVAR